MVMEPYTLDPNIEPAPARESTGRDRGPRLAILTGDDQGYQSGYKCGALVSECWSPGLEANKSRDFTCMRYTTQEQ